MSTPTLLLHCFAIHHCQKCGKRLTFTLVSARYMEFTVGHPEPCEEWLKRNSQCYYTGKDGWSEEI